MGETGMRKQAALMIQKEKLKSNNYFPGHYSEWKIRLFALCILFLFLGQGCKGFQPPTLYGNDPLTLKDSNLVSISYTITDRLLENVQEELVPDRTILVASLVDVKYMEQSSNFGRIMAECITSRLSQKGFMVVEMKLRESLYIKEQEGEFLLSRKVKDISQTHDAQAVVVGTYAKADTEVYISARIVQAVSGKIISSCDFRIPMTQNMQTMFQSPFTGFPAATQ